MSAAPGASLLDAMLALDLLTLRNAEGGPLGAAAWRAQLAATLARSRAVVVWQGAQLAGYALLQPAPELGGAGDWFVTGFNTHPQCRSAGLMRALLGRLRRLGESEGIRRLHSHVYRHNRASLAFHRRLGFQVVQENAQAVALSVAWAALRLPGVPGRSPA